MLFPSSSKSNCTASRRWRSRFLLWGCGGVYHQQRRWQKQSEGTKGLGEGLRQPLHPPTRFSRLSDANIHTNTHCLVLKRAERERRWQEEKGLLISFRHGNLCIAHWVVSKIWTWCTGSTRKCAYVRVCERRREKVVNLEKQEEKQSGVNWQNSKPDG